MSWGIILLLETHDIYTLYNNKIKLFLKKKDNYVVKPFARKSAMFSQ